MIGTSDGAIVLCDSCKTWDSDTDDGEGDDEVQDEIDN